MKLLKFIGDILNRNSSISEKDIKLYVLLYAAAWMCLGIHVAHLVAFLLSHITFYTLVNIASVLCYLVMLVLCHCRKFTVAALLLSIEVCLYALIVSLTSGAESYILIYYIFVIMFQIILPYGTKRFRSVALAVVLLVFLINLLYCWGLELIHISLPVEWNSVFAVTNLIVIVFGVVICLYIDDLIRYTLSQTQQMKLKELQDAANKDSLTGLYNRRYAEEALRLCVESQNDKNCVVLLDIDNFKVVNDTYGHAAGDVVLVRLAEFLQSHLRRGDFIFRWGGEEFLILLSGTTVEDCVSTVDKLRVKFSKMDVGSEGVSLYVTFTAGVSRLDLDDIDESIRRSDENLYKGKESGRNKVVF